MRIKLKNRRCERCGKEFVPHTRNQIFCSKRCTKKKHNDEFKKVHTETESPRGRQMKEEPWDVQSVTEMLKQKLVVGKSYVLELREVEANGRVKKILKRAKLVGKYPHHATFENAMGIRTHLSFQWWELKGLLKGEC